MNFPDHISESLETIVGLKILKFLMWIQNLFDPGSGMEKFGSGIRDIHPVSAALLKIIKNFRQQLHRGNFIICFFCFTPISDLDPVYLFDRSGSTCPKSTVRIISTLESEIHKYGSTAP
jgi:hypothetical protein